MRAHPPYCSGHRPYTHQVLQDSIALRRIGPVSSPFEQLWPSATKPWLGCCGDEEADEVGGVGAVPCLGDRPFDQGCVHERHRGAVRDDEHDERGPNVPG